MFGLFDWAIISDRKQYCTMYYSNSDSFDFWPETDKSETGSSVSSGEPFQEIAKSTQHQAKFVRNVSKFLFSFDDLIGVCADHQFVLLFCAVRILPLRDVRMLPSGIIQLRLLHYLLCRDLFFFGKAGGKQLCN